MKKRALTILQYVFFLALGLFLVWWTIRDLNANDRSQIKTSLRHARYFLIIPVFIILITSHYVRGLRWRLLIEPLGYKTKKSNALFSVMIGYLTNLAFPRLGEVVKCTALSRYEKVSVDKLIGTVILERIVDVLSLLVIFGITLVIQPGIYTQLVETLFQNNNSAKSEKTSALIIILVIIGIIILGLIGWMVIKKKKPADIVNLIKSIILRIWEGVTTIQHLKKRAYFIFLTVALWTLYLLCGYLGFFALQETEHYGIKEAFTVLSAGSIGMIIPTPGGIGSYAYLVQKTMILYGLNEGIALAFGWMLWVAQTSVLLIGGLFSFVALPYFNKKRIEKS
ncbi:MAG TPA: lysylphosphatidylglycerol synthase transmembrane domain-containing protein [Chitinophagaceae bacterium]|nr:lysylphosphatidylglycerol synthase transmembrane domain-containing protein [Chitinophagaceae bacterium]